MRMAFSQQLPRRCMAQWLVAPGCPQDIPSFLLNTRLPRPSTSSDYILWPFPTSKKPSRISWRPDTRWQRCRDLAVFCCLGRENISQSRITVPHLSKRGLHFNIEFLQPKSPNFKAPHSEEQISYTFYQFYNFKVHILSLLMRAIYTARPWGRNVIILCMCAQTV